MRLLILILLISFLILESSVTTTPLIIPVIVVATVMLRDYIAFLLAFIFGFLLDILTFKTVGLSSLLLTILVFLILMYERKFEIETPRFIIFSTFLSSFIFIILFQRGNLIIQPLVSVLIGLILFEGFKRINVKGKEND